MHGRQRSEYKAMQRDPKVAAALGKKAEQWYALTSQISDENALLLSEKLLTVNPDPLYLWNQRRTQFQSSSKQAMDWETEDRLTAAALQNNPKAYGAWFHRKWCLVQQETTTKALQQELALTVRFLDRDERNFHCWNYRRLIVSLLLMKNAKSSPLAGAGAGAWNLLLEDKDEPLLLMGNQVALSETMDKTDGTSDDDSTDWIAHEWDFTQQKIQQNFSNFSAFHYRSKLYELVQPTMKDELSLVENAIFTEPDDQTAWWYQSFLLRQSTADRPEWEGHVANLQELLEEVPNSKWVVLGLMNCGMQQKILPNDRLLDLCRKLMVLDSDRKGRYMSLEKRFLKA
mmetsp:Transcript_3107/g.4198  ORF Transcript_3107/g.4198 Transcript_3107/m.4198 type:complete len:343 (-) Transcript_3107:153-1181(-)|eukprot:CAMPEP_0198146348 /NCGR_PEP_ID=MMETSP1443-20131203/28988_1 /TAXON_ID=186043 /ORGANISM="Entomoneis sp., Strain CCMP2396" /LENGTH=342 /DNA_ID=CAMNT_0043810283 /DNA_START=30 /DNA_END=1058 /DNA_ORIENTATION=-